MCYYPGGYLLDLCITGMGTPLSCDNTVTSSLSIFNQYVNKSYNALRS